MIRPFRIIALLATLTTLTACADEEEAPATRASSGLSTSFKTQCAVCHGKEGRGLGPAPRLPGRNDSATYRAAVRTGRGSTMPAFSLTELSDEQLDQDFRTLSALP